MSFDVLIIFPATNTAVTASLDLLFLSMLALYCSGVFIRETRKASHYQIKVSFEILIVFLATKTAVTASLDILFPSILLISRLHSRGSKNLAKCHLKVRLKESHCQWDCSTSAFTAADAHIIFFSHAGVYEHAFSVLILCTTSSMRFEEPHCLMPTNDTLGHPLPRSPASQT